jgi:plastocyanin
MKLLRACAAAAAGLLAGSVAAPAVELAGRVVLTEKGRPTTDATLDLRRALVWFEPAGKPPPLAPLEAEMATVRKQFQPQVLAVPVGSTVRFPNLDPILHNVFSVSGANGFDLGLVGGGKGKSATFREAGVVRVFCNVHHAMFGYVVVVATPFYGAPDALGAFRLERLPAGPGRLTVWHERGEPQVRDVVLPAPGPIEARIEITLPRVPRHKNKFGKSYSGGGYG